MTQAKVKSNSKLFSRKRVYEAIYTYFVIQALRKYQIQQLEKIRAKKVKKAAEFNAAEINVKKMFEQRSGKSEKSPFQMPSCSCAKLLRG